METCFLEFVQTNIGLYVKYRNVNLLNFLYIL